jgi:hypothetical protein
MAKYVVARQRAIREHPHMLHSYITNATGHSLRLLPPGHHARNRLLAAAVYHEKKATEAISLLLKEQAGVVPDHIILAIMTVCFPAGDYDEYVSRYPSSPLAQAQSLHLYANLDMTPHRIRQLQTLCRLLETRGNLEGVAHNEWVHVLIL